MPSKGSRPSLADIERLVLRAMCQGTAEGPVVESGRRLLSGYRWSEPLHQAIFEVLAALPTASPEIIPEQLPALLTRRGYPDVSWEVFLKPPSLSRPEAEALMNTLRDVSGQSPGSHR